MSDLGDRFKEVLGLMTGQYRVDQALAYKRRSSEIPEHRHDNLVKSVLTGLFCAASLGAVAFEVTGQAVPVATAAITGVLLGATIRQSFTAYRAREIESQITNRHHP